MTCSVTGLSDTHLRYDGVPPASDILVIAGDVLAAGTQAEYQQFLRWLGKVRNNHTHVCITSGNHDRWMETDEFNVKGELRHKYDTDLLIAEEISYTIRGETKRIFGTPYISKIGRVSIWAYELPRGPLLAAKWDEIPGGLDLLVLHMPPQGIMDRSVKVWDGLSEEYGCPDLRTKLLTMHNPPKIVVSGHIHSKSGIEEGVLKIPARHGDVIEFRNLSICDEMYEVAYEPHVFEI